MPSTMLGARRCVDAAHELGIPVVAGGRGFGGCAGRALALGADTYAADVGGAVAWLERWDRHPPTLVRVGSAAELLAAADDVPRLVTRVMHTSAPRAGVDPLGLDAPTLRDGTRQFLECVVAAVLTGDDDVLAEVVEWVATFLEVRGVERRWFEQVLGAVCDAVTEWHPGCVDTLARVAAGFAAGRG